MEQVMAASKEAAAEEERQRVERDQQEAAARVGPEPAADAADVVCLSFKVPPRPVVEDEGDDGAGASASASTSASSGAPGGQRLQRRFLGHDKLCVVVDYLRSTEELKGRLWSLYTSFPSALLGEAEQERTLEELKLTPRALLLVRDSDA